MLFQGPEYMQRGNRGTQILSPYCHLHMKQILRKDCLRALSCLCVCLSFHFFFLSVLLTVSSEVENLK